MRLSHSGRAFHVAFGTQAQEAFLEGHVLAFEHFGGVPGRIRYDNLKPAVVRVLRGPGPARVGAVHRAAQPLRVRLVLLPPRHGRRAREGRGRGRDRPVPPPPPRPGPGVASLAELNELIAAGDLLDDARVITGRPVTVGAAFAAELPTLLPLPAEPFDPARLLQARVDNRARVSVRQCYYSVPGPLRRAPADRPADRHHGRGPRRRRRVVARHERAVGRYVEVLSWTTTWRSSRSSPARCPARPRWPRPRRAARSPPPPALLGRRPPRPRRRRRHPRADRGPARPPHPARARR